MTLVQLIAGIGLFASVIMTLIRLIRGEDSLSRAVALEVITVTLISVICFVMIIYDTTTLSDFIIITSLLPFVGSLAFSQYIANTRSK